MADSESPVTLQDITPECQISKTKSVDRDVPLVSDVVKTDSTGPPDMTQNFTVCNPDGAILRKGSPISSIQTEGSDICQEPLISSFQTEGSGLPGGPPISYITSEGADLHFEAPMSFIKTDCTDLPGEPQIRSIMTEGVHIQNESQLCYVSTEGDGLQEVPLERSVSTESFRLPGMLPVCSVVKTDVGDDSQVWSVVKTEVGDDSQVCSVVKTEVGDDSQVCSVVKTEVGDDSQVFCATAEPKPLVCSMQTDNVNIQNGTQISATVKTEVVCFPDIPHITDVGSAIESDTGSAPQKTVNLTATGLYVNVSNSRGSRLLDTSTPMRGINECVNQPTEARLRFEGGSVQTNSVTRTSVAEAETAQPPNRGEVTEATGGLWYEDPKYQPVVELERLPCVEAIALRTQSRVITSVDIPVNHQVQRASSCDGTHHEISRRLGSETTTPVKPQSLRMTASTGRQNTEQQQKGNVNSSQNLRFMLFFPICENPFTLGTHQNNVVESSHTKRPQSVETGENYYTCVSCQKTFTSQYNFKLHQQFHSDLDRIKMHLFNHTREKIYTCDICHKSFIDSNYLKKHLSTHSAENPYMCDICKKTFKTSSQLEFHVFRHTTNKIYKCNTCQKGFKRMIDLKKHMLIIAHAGEKTYTCTICQKRFSNKQNLSAHNLIHRPTGIESFACNICPKRYRNSKSLKYHQLTHSGEKPHTCDICQKKFSRKSNLLQHKLTHTGVKAHACNICYKRYRNSQSLKCHQLTHSGEKPHTCDICQKSFWSRSNLTQHKLTHTGVTSHTCDICQKSFGVSQSLKLHKLTHSGEKPHTCEICQKGFSQKGSLKKHQKAMHQGAVSQKGLRPGLELVQT